MIGSFSTVNSPITLDEVVNLPATVVRGLTWVLHVGGALVAGVVIVSAPVLEPIAFESLGDEVVLVHDEIIY